VISEGALRTLEFDRIVELVAAGAVTSTGRERLAELRPLIEVDDIRRAQQATSEGTRFLADHPGFPLRAPSDLDAILDALAVDGRALEAVRLRGLADYLESVEQSRAIVSRLGDPLPLLRALVERVASFTGEIADVRRKIDPGGDVVDDASPALAGIRDRLRRQRSKLRSTLDGFLRGRDTAKYLQDQVVTDRNGRYVLVVRAEHRSSIPGIVHGASASGASLYLEPLGTVEINNDIVALEEQEAEEVRRILLALTDAFRGRPDDLRRTVDVATELDAIQARARYSLSIQGIEPAISTDGAFELKAARHPLLRGRGGV
jgi:DNA mismatch repair protein MutS2